MSKSQAWLITLVCLTGLTVGRCSRPQLRAQSTFVPGVAKVAIANPYGWCQEVVMGLVYALLPLTPQLHLYWSGQWPLTEDSWVDADKFLASLSKGRLLVYNYADIHTRGTEYDVVIWADHHLWDHQHRDAGPAMLLNAGFQGKLWIFCHEPTVVFRGLQQDPDWRLNATFQNHSGTVISHPQVSWFAITPHVAATTEKWLHLVNVTNKHVHWLCPVFSINSSHSHLWHPAPWRNRKGFAIQGNTDAHRRNYTGLLQDVAISPELIQDPRFSLEIYSFGELMPNIIPPAARPKVFHHHLPYQAYYAQMSDALALMTMFPGTRYYTDASSSTVATAISLGLPLIVDTEFVGVYNFISPRALVIADHSSHAVALQRMLAMSESEWTYVALEMAVTREAMVMRNMQLLNKLLLQAGPALSSSEAQQTIVHSN